MVNVTYKKKGLNINAIIGKQFTLITDLTILPEEIFKQFSKNYRYEINRGKKEKVKCISYNSLDLKNDSSLLSSFKKEYEDFVKLKKIANAYNKFAMEQYIESGNIILTKAYSDEEDYAQHIYVYEDDNRKIARLLYSVSNFRTKGVDRNLIGRANKYLHWYDIQYLCNHNINILDWGGISSIDKTNGVDKFKKEFGGHEHSYYNVIIGKSLIGKLAVSLMKLKRG